MATSSMAKFSECVIPQMISSGCFGPASKIIDYKVDNDRKGEDQFASTVQFFELYVKVGDVLQTIHVVVKFQLENPLVRELLQLKNLFHNENLLYSEILPMIDKDGIVNELFPKFYHGMIDSNYDSDLDYIVLNDLSKKGYRLTTERVLLDYDHCILALKQIGKFHALSYAAKKNKYSEFNAAVSKIRRKWSAEKILDLKYFLLLCGKRGVLPLIDKKEHAELLTNFLKNYDDPAEFFSYLVTPVEPEAVLCHGDFCRNNMLFLYDDAGKPVSVKFFDLQTPQYTSPVIDLSFFLLMNTALETREKHWNEFISVYKQSLKSVVPDIDVPDLDFRRVGIYGYILCSFFQPIMMIEDRSDVSFEDNMKFTSYEQGLKASQVGGEKETQCLVDIIQFLLSRGYIRETYF